MRSLDKKRLAQFEPQGVETSAPSQTNEAVPTKEHKRWVSREPQEHGTFTLRASLEDISTFKRLSAEDRRKHGDMFRMMIDAYRASINDT